MHGGFTHVMARSMRMKKKKNLYMNRTILMIAMVGYISLLVLLLTMSIFTINSEYNSRVDSVLSDINRISTKVDDDMQLMSNYFYNIYDQDTDFDSLAENEGAKTGNYSVAYMLNNRMKTNQSMSDWMDAYYLSYGSGDDRQWLFNSDTTIIPFEESQRIKDAIQNSFDTGIHYLGLYMETTENNGYWMVFYSKGNATITGVSQISRYFATLPKEKYMIEKSMIWDPDITNAEYDKYYAKYHLEERDLELEDKFITRSGKTYLVGQKLSYCGLWYFCEINGSYLFQATPLEIFLLLLTVLSVLLMIILYRLMVKRYVRPMYQLVEVMEGIRSGTLSEVPDLKLSFYEQNLINTVLQKMVEDIRHERLKTYEETIVRRETELQLMKMQLNPHFYLNCLKTLNAMAVDAGMENMQEMILRISEILRNVLYSNENMVKLSQEINFTENYVELQKLLSDRKLECSFEIEDGLEYCMIPSLAVQTFVENSIKYASLDPIKKSLSITITIMKLQLEDEREVLDIMVADSGQGYPEELLPGLNKKYFYEASGVGLNNLKRRCDIIYGDNVEYSFYNMDGAVSELILPTKGTGTMGEQKNEGIIGR